MRTLNYLVGMPGIGKSYYSQKLSQHLSIKWIDLDQYIEEQQGDIIANIIKSQGEEFFRLYEATALRRVSDRNDLDLVSTGGGTPCFCDNMDYMQGHGRVIYLNASPHYLVDSYRKYDLTRPLAKGQNIENYIHNTYNQRHPIYRQAHHIIDVSKGQEAVIDELKNVVDLVNDPNK